MAGKNQKRKLRTAESLLSRIRRLLPKKNSTSVAVETGIDNQVKKNKTNIPVEEGSLSTRKKVEYPDYVPIERSTPEPSSPIERGRYFMKGDGHYMAIEPRGEGSAVLLFTGDIMCRGGQQKAAINRYGEYRFDDSFSEVKPIFNDSDLVAGNLETTLCASSPYMSEMTPINGRPHDNAPPTFLAALRYAGFDLIAMANNHNCDAGVYGIIDTLKNVEDYEFMHT